MSFIKTEINRKLEFSLCRQKFLDMLKIVEGRITNKEVKNLIEKINEIKQNELKNLKDKKKIKVIVESLKIINNY